MPSASDEQHDRLVRVGADVVTHPVCWDGDGRGRVVLVLTEDDVRRIADVLLRDLILRADLRTTNLRQVEERFTCRGRARGHAEPGRADVEDIVRGDGEGKGEPVALRPHEGRLLHAEAAVLRVGEVETAAYGVEAVCMPERLIDARERRGRGEGVIDGDIERVARDVEEAKGELETYCME